MKKVISLILAVACVFTLILTLTACKGDSDDNETTQNNSEQSVVVGYTAKVTEDSLMIYKDGEFVEQLSYPEAKKADFVLAFAQDHIAFKDLDFDGNLDICLAVNSLGDGFVYYCWIFDGTRFVYNEELSSFKTITIDSAKKHVISTEKDKDGKTVYIVYEWKNGKLEKVTVEDELSDTAESNVLGAVSSNKVTTPNKENNQSNNSQDNNSENNNGNSNSAPNNSGSSNSGSNEQNPGIFYQKGDNGDVWY